MSIIAGSSASLTVKMLQWFNCNICQQKNKLNPRIAKSVVSALFLVIDEAKLYIKC
jgi:hypothetical protein